MNAKSQSIVRRVIASAQSIPISTSRAWKWRANCNRLALALAAALVPLATQAAKPKPPPPPSSPAYVPVLVGGLRSSEGGINTFVYDLNNAGQVVGNTSIPGYPYDQYSQAFLLNPRDTNTDGSPDTWFVDQVQNATGALGSDGQNDLIIGLGTLPGSRNSQARAVNDAGFVVGVSQSYNAVAEAFIVLPKDNDRDGRADCWYEDSDGDGYNDLMVPLGRVAGLGDSFTPEELNINNLGQVVGWFYDANGVLQSSGFLLTPVVDEAGVRQWFQDDGNGANALMLGLGTFIPRSINDSGQTVGSSGGRAVLRSPKGSLIDLGAGTQSEARVINNHGQIGLYSLVSGQGHAGLLTPVDGDDDGTPDLWYRDQNGDGVNDLIVDLGGVQGLDSSYVAAHGLNDAGAVVGASCNSGGRYVGMRRSPFLWQNGALRTLKDLTGGAVEFWDVFAINNAGQIVCQSSGNGFYENGNAYILLPSH